MAWNIPGMSKPEALLELSSFVLALVPMLQKLRSRQMPNLADAQKAAQAGKQVVDVFKNFEEEFGAFNDETVLLLAEPILAARDTQLVADFDRFYAALNEEDAELFRRIIYTAFKLKEYEGVADAMQAIASKKTDTAMRTKFDGLKLKVKQNQELGAKELGEKLGQALRYAWDTGVLPAGKFAGEFLLARGQDVGQTLGSISAAITAERVAGDPNSSLMAWAKEFAKGK